MNAIYTSNFVLDIVDLAGIAMQKYGIHFILVHFNPLRGVPAHQNFTAGP